MYVDSSNCVRVKGGESDLFKIKSGVKQVYHVTLSVVYGWNDEGGE